MLHPQMLHVPLLHSDRTGFLYYDGVTADNVCTEEAKETRCGIEPIPFRASEVRADKYAVHHAYREFESILNMHAL